MVDQYWQVFFSAMVPLTELRGSIPLGIGIFGLHPLWVLAISWLGNIVPVIIILLFLGPITNWLRKLHKILDKFFTWLFAHTYRKHSAKFDRWGSLALMLFVALPLPVTGGWTGALLAYLFGIKLRFAIPNILIGLAISGILVTTITMGSIWALSL